MIPPFLTDNRLEYQLEWAEAESQWLRQQLIWEARLRRLEETAGLIPPLNPNRAAPATQ